jgi:hypothetical protein
MLKTQMLAKFVARESNSDGPPAIQTDSFLVILVTQQ